MHVVIQDSSLVICASHEGLGLLLRVDIESLIVDAFESALDYCILLTLDLKNMLVQIDNIHTHSLPITGYIPWNTLCHIVFYILLINQTVHLRSESHELCDTMSVVLVPEGGTRQHLIEVEERWKQRELAPVHFLLVVVHELSIEVTCVIQF